MMEVKNLVEQLKNSIGKQLEAVVLFGSRARGDASPESNWDILVVVHNLPKSPIARQKWLIKLLGPHLNFPVEFHLLTPDEWYNRISPLTLEIALDGKVLHDSEGKTKEFLNRLRNRLNELGLVRKRSSDKEYIWVWQGDKPVNWFEKLMEVMPRESVGGV